MSTMIERVARAIRAAPRFGENNGPVESQADIDREFAEPRAAIQAMREPTPKIIAAMRLAQKNALVITDDEFADFWRAGIDAALGEDSEGSK